MGAPLPYLIGLPIRYRRFVRVLLITGDQGQAYKATGNKYADDRDAQNKGSRFMQKPRIQKALNEAIMEEYPDLRSEFAEQFARIIRALKDLDIKDPTFEKLFKLSADLVGAYPVKEEKKKKPGIGTPTFTPPKA